LLKHKNKYDIALSKLTSSKQYRRSRKKIIFLPIMQCEKGRDYVSISIKSEKEIELMRESGRILANVLEELEAMVRPGISTLDIDKKCAEIIRSYECVPSFLNYNGFPASVCISINDEVVHGIPNKNRILRDGDIVSLDCGVIYHGFHSDAARTVAVGEISKEAKQLIEVTKQSFY